MDIHQQILHRLDGLEKSRALILKTMNDQTEWIQYLDAERQIQMAKIEDLETALAEVTDAVAGIKERFDTQTQELADARSHHDEVTQAVIDHANAIRDQLRGIGAVQAATPADDMAESAPEPPQGQQDAPDMGVTADETAR